MGADAPDPGTLKSGNDAFQFPISAVRRMEQQLRTDLTANREKLRALVGASYRDLLDTAEQIIEMNGQIQRVETDLGVIGQKCNSRSLEREGRNYGRWDWERRTRVLLADKERCALASQLAVFTNCPTVMSRLLRKNGSTLLAAKILVISRLLHKTLAQSNAAPPFVESLRNQLASLRRKLLNRIDRQLSNMNINAFALTEAMCAYSLATSSTPKDVLRHFHHVRLEAIVGQLWQSDEGHENVLKALRLYIRTLQDTQTVLPKRLEASLERLKSQPLIRDPDIQAVVEFNLEVHERWIAEDVRNFIPWMRHEDLQKSDVNDLLRGWAKKAIHTFTEGLKDLLTSVQDLNELLQLRKNLLDVWLSSHSRVHGLGSPEALDGLRSAINAQFTSLIRLRAKELHLVGSEIKRILEGWRLGQSNSHSSLWDPSITSMDISNGATEFKKTILDQIYGRDSAILIIMLRYERWRGFVDEVDSVIKNLREGRWADELEASDDDENESDCKQALLTKADPSCLEEAIDEALKEAFEELQRVIEEGINASQVTAGGPRYIFLLRLLREFRDHLPRQKDTETFELKVLPQLHSIIAKEVSARPIRLFQRRIKGKLGGQVTARAIWEGTPQLPVQPSVAIFRLLHELIASMAECGSDVWSPAATQALKDWTKKQLAASLAQIPRYTARSILANGHNINSEEGEEDHAPSEGTTNGTYINGNTEDPKLGTGVQEDSTVQHLLDVLILQKALSTSHEDSGDNELVALEQSLQSKLELDKPSHERLQKAALEYWKRSCLFFSLLA
ncbi:MAG: hypothetical protein M1827_003567 [Pycnora praestabilis]|nr:MAG: hypothetical protein M1827_003567 [Pycnora praestabilis]